MQNREMIPIYVAHSGRVEKLELVVKSDKEWQLLLTPQEYDVTRKKGTEPAFTGKYHDFKQPGLYQCVCCGIDLFSSGANLILVLVGPVFLLQFLILI